MLNNKKKNIFSNLYIILFSILLDWNIKKKIEIYNRRLVVPALIIRIQEYLFSNNHCWLKII